MRKKFIGPPNPDGKGEELGHDVLVAGHPLGTVRPGEIIDVPDELAKQVAWPDSRWEDAPAKKKGES